MPWKNAHEVNSGLKVNLWLVNLQVDLSMEQSALSDRQHVRVTLNREHLGVSSDDEYCDVTDPVDADFYKNVWLKQASINTTIYDKVSQYVQCINQR